jgi:hypothetical protein
MVSLDIFHADPFKAIQLTMAPSRRSRIFPDGLESDGHLR